MNCTVPLSPGRPPRRRGEAAAQGAGQRHQLAINQFAKADHRGRVSAPYGGCGAARRHSRRLPGDADASGVHAGDRARSVRRCAHAVAPGRRANRADIRRLCQLEADKAALEAKLEREQQALHEAIVTRDAGHPGPAPGAGAEGRATARSATEGDRRRRPESDGAAPVGGRPRRRLASETRCGAASHGIGPPRSAR